MLNHNHLHCIVPGGVLGQDGTWKSANGFLFPVKVLSKLFRGIYISKLRILCRQKKLKLPKQLTQTLNARQFNQLLDGLMKQDWVVYAKPPFAGPEKLLSYLGRYTHKIAISNHRLISCDQKSVSFKWRDYADNNKEKIMTLNPEEFIRRFLSHVVPDGFMRIRSFGFLSNASRAKKIKALQQQLNYTAPSRSTEKKDTASLMLHLAGTDITICPQCKIGKLKKVADIPTKFSNTVFDTS